MKLRFLCLIFLMLPAYGAFGQFSVIGEPGEDVLFRAIDTVRYDPMMVDNFENQAYRDMLRRKRRNERNTFEFNGTLQLSQTQFDNWAQGGDNTFSTRSTMFVQYSHRRERFSLGTKFEARYGMNYIEKEKYKNEDEFKINVTTGYKIKDNWSYAATTNLRSQFTTGYVSRTNDTRKSTFMAPGFLDISVGFMYTRKPFNVVISPVGGSAIFVLDDELREKGINGVDPGKRSQWQVGPSIKADLDWEFMKKVCRLRSSLYSFTNIKTPPTVRWENTLEIRASRYITTTLYGMLMYDKEADTPKPDHIQYKYSLSLGLSYTFKNK